MSLASREFQKKLTGRIHRPKDLTLPEKPAEEQTAAVVQQKLSIAVFVNSFLDKLEKWL